MPRALVRPGLELCYERFGRPEDPPLLLIMGVGAQMLLWDERLCRAFAAAGFQVIRFDNRDVGESTWLRDLPTPDPRRAALRFALGRPVEAPYTLDDMADDAAGLIEALGLGAAHVVGASMGGMIAQLLALRHPDRVRSLTSIMSSPGGRRYMVARPRAVRALLRPVPPGREGAGDHYLALMSAIGSPALPRDAEATRALGMRCFDRGSNPRGFLRQVAAILAAPPRARRLAALRCPTLVVHGVADPLVLPAAGRATARAIPGARLDLVRGMGHDLPEALWPRLVEGLSGLARVR